MSKERLEEIKKTQYQIIELSKTNMQEDFNYLLSYIDNLEMAFDDLDSDYIDLVKQNKRYREALGNIDKLMRGKRRWFKEDMHIMNELKILSVESKIQMLLSLEESE